MAAAPPTVSHCDSLTHPPTHPHFHSHLQRLQHPFPRTNALKPCGHHHPSATTNNDDDDDDDDDDVRLFVRSFVRSFGRAFARLVGWLVACLLERLLVSWELSEFGGKLTRWVRNNSHCHCRSRHSRETDVTRLVFVGCSCVFLS